MHNVTVDSPAPRNRAALGTALLLAGAALTALRLIEQSAGLPLDLPRFWYTNRPLWFAAAIGLFLAGCALLRPAASSSPVQGRTQQAWQPGQQGARFRRLILYTRRNCPLCEEAKEVLRTHADFLPAWEEIDIDTDPVLVERFGQCVPVVELDGKVRFRGRIPTVLLRRLISGTPPLTADSTEQQP